MNSAVSYEGDTFKLSFKAGTHVNTPHDGSPTPFLYDVSMPGFNVFMHRKLQMQLRAGCAIGSPPSWSSVRDVKRGTRVSRQAGSKRVLGRPLRSLSVLCIGHLAFSDPLSIERSSAALVIASAPNTAQSFAVLGPLEFRL